MLGKIPSFLFSCLIGIPLLMLSVAAQESPSAPLNQLILESLRSMPVGGGYSAGTLATRALQRSVKVQGATLAVDASRATPSYCSGATYLVFLKAVEKLQDRHLIELSPACVEALRPAGQPDGTGIWGRWNANGPGTACLFEELKLGRNFSELSKARPGDFLKIFWNDGIGASEHGHSVIFLGSGIRNGMETLTYWSSNIPGGFGEKTVPCSRIHRMLFSRFEHPASLSGAAVIRRSDPYLAGLEHRSSAPAEMLRQCGIAR